MEKINHPICWCGHIAQDHDEDKKGNYPCDRCDCKDYDPIVDTNND